jgi:hypothetical protein
MKTRFLLIQLLAICLVGCAATAIPGASPDLLGFLVAGRTTRSQVLTTLGQPSARFEGDRILTYRIGHRNEQGYFVSVPEEYGWTAQYSLVLVFNSRGVLQKQNLVEVR